MNLKVLDKLALLLLLVLCRHEDVVGFGPLTPAAVSSRPSVPAVIGSAAAAARGPLSARAAGDGTSSMFEKCPVLICPAQLSVPSDYELMIAEFKER